MPVNRKLILDTHCEIYHMIKDRADGIFWNLQQHVAKGELVTNAVYIIGREQLRLNAGLIRQLVVDGAINVIFSNPHEGSATIKGHLIQYGVLDLVESRKIAVITGGDQESGWNYLKYEHFLTRILLYKENTDAIQKYKDLYSTNRPYKFLFLNGRARPHRKYFLERLQLSGLLDQSIWTNLDSRFGPGLMLQENNSLSFMHEGIDLVQRPFPIKYSDPKYEVELYSNRVGQSTTEGFVKMDLFNNTWGDIYLRADPYLDTYFSLITETVYLYPYSFRTEKLWKPLSIGHPFIVASGCGYYKDLHNLGFQTFGHLIDESFDQIDNDQLRIERTADIVEDLCRQDLASFLVECQEVCKYNQQHFAELALQTQLEFPERFDQFIKQYYLDE
jgi:hypothetical protein